MCLLMTYFTDRQLEIIADAVEDYAALVSDDLADEYGEILDIIEAHQTNKNYSKRWSKKVAILRLSKWDKAQKVSTFGYTTGAHLVMMVSSDITTKLSLLVANTTAEMLLTR